MLQNLLSLNSSTSTYAAKSPVSSANADTQGGFGRALRDVGHSNSDHATGGSAGRADNGQFDQAGQSGSKAAAAPSHDKLGGKKPGAGETSDEVRSHQTDGSSDPSQVHSSEEPQEAIQIGLQSIDGMVLANTSNNFGTGLAANGTDPDGFAQLRGLQSGLGVGIEGLPAKNEVDPSKTVPGVANVLSGDIQLGTKGTAQTLAEMAAGRIPGVPLQTAPGGLKSDGRDPLDKANSSLPGLSNLLKEGGNIDAAAKELPRSELNGLRVAPAADENAQRTNSEAGTFKDGDSLLVAAKAGTETGSAKSVNELALGNLTSTSQTLVNAVKENSNWSKMMSAPTVNFSETMRPNGKVLQALSVTLNPVELGKLELNLRMQQGQVTIDVRTESDQAYRTLLVDQDALVNTLRSLGFKVDGININGPQSENSTQFQNPGQSENQAAGEGASGETSGDNGTYSDEAFAGANEGAIVDEEDRASLNVI